MSKLRFTLVVLSFLSRPLFSLAQISPTVAFVPNLSIRIRVYNIAKISPVVLSEAEQQATRIFDAAGTEIAWQECPCSGNLGSLDFMLRIVPRLFGSTRNPFREDNLGFAAVDEDGGILATVFYHRVEVLTRGGNTSKLLGHAIAHEIGHLLLGSKAHTDKGIMRAYWSKDYLKSINRGQLLFTPEQVNLIHTHLTAASIRQTVAPGSNCLLREPDSIEGQAWREQRGFHRHDGRGL
jgi:hypothetical protein